MRIIEILLELLKNYKTSNNYLAIIKNIKILALYIVSQIYCLYQQKDLQNTEEELFSECSIYFSCFVLALPCFAFYFVGFFLDLGFLFLLLERQKDILSTCDELHQMRVTEIHLISQKILSQDVIVFVCRDAHYNGWGIKYIVV